MFEAQNNRMWEEASWRSSLSSGTSHGHISWMVSLLLDSDILKLCLSRTTSWPKEALFYLLVIYLSMNSIQPESQRKWLYHWKKTTYFILRPLFTFQRVCQRRVNLELLEDTVRVGIWKADYIIPIPSQWFKHKPIYYNLGFKWGFSEIRPCFLSFTGASLLWSLTMAETWEV